MAKREASPGLSPVKKKKAQTQKWVQLQQRIWAKEDQTEGSNMLTARCLII